MTSPVPPALTAPPTGMQARLFDLRHLLGGVLGVYGLILCAVGATDTPRSLAMADGMPINMLVGVVLLAAAAIFLVWAMLDHRRAASGRTPPGD